MSNHRRPTLPGPAVHTAGRVTEAISFLWDRVFTGATVPVVHSARDWMARRDGVLIVQTTVGSISDVTVQS